MKQVLLRLIITMALLLPLCACISLKSPTQGVRFNTIPFSERQAQLTRLSAWTIEGAVSLQMTGQNPIIAHYHWQQQNLQNYHITLAAPLNLMQLAITATPQNVTLTGTQGKTVSAPAPEQLLQQTVGWSMPISQLVYWIRGIPNPLTSIQAIQVDPFGHLTRLVQNGWEVNFSNYQTFGAMDLPGTIQLQNQGVHLKIVIKQWQLPVT